jgi:hypothetical protein
MALIKASASSRKIERAVVTIVSVIDLPASKCPVNKETSEVIPKCLLIDTDGVAYGVLSSKVKNLPVAFPKEGIECNLSFENTEYVNKKGETVEGSNILNAEFNSKLRYVVSNAKAVSVAGMD